MEDKILNLIGIKTKQGIFITQFNRSDKYQQYSNLNRYKINGDFPETTFNSFWNLINGEPKIITLPQSPEKENYRFVLKDSSMASNKIPLQLLKDEVCYYIKEDYYWEWKEEYKHLKSLYDETYDEIEQPDKIINFNYQEIVEVDELRNIKDFDWEIYKTQWTHDGTKKVGIYDLKYQLIDKIMFPDIYYEQYCSVTLPSKKFYDIIRFYIKSNINLKVAEITSDYDFCFTVKKRIMLIEPQIVKKEQLKSNGRSYSRPKFTTQTHQYADSFIIFEMTHKERSYDKYPILPDLVANNIDELQNKVDNILKNLIKFINEPVSICPHCNGTGINQKVSRVDLDKMINGN